MKLKKIIAIATAAAFAFTGTAYAETGENLATEGNDVTAVIEDISLTGDRIETDDTSFYTGDVTVNYSLCDESGISSVAVVVNGEKLAEKKYDTSDCMETADGEVMNVGSTAESEGTDAQANTTAPLTAVSDDLTISMDDIKALEEAKAAEPVAEPAAEEPVAEEASEPEAAQPETEAAEPAAAPEAEATEAPAGEPATEATAPAAEPDPVADSTYNAELVVTDVNGNTETKTFDFNAVPSETPAEEQEAVETLRAAGNSSAQVVDSTTYRVEVNLTCQAVTIYKKNLSGSYDPIRVAICSTGRSGKTTPTGTFTIGPYKKKCARSKWALLSGGSSYAQYLVRIHHGICFHSTIYKTRGDNSKMYKSEYNKLGGVASAGCVRMRVIDAKWIYDHCPNGTTVKIYRSSTASPLGVPTFKKLTTSASLTWDPTDPDTGNPAFGGRGKATGVYLDYEEGLPVVTLSPDLANHVVNLSSTKLVYNGKVRHPSVNIYGLTKDTNYTVEYPEGCKYVGTYTVTVNGIGSFTGSKTATFTIVPMATKIKSVKRAGSKQFTISYNKVRKQISGYEIMYSKNSKFKKGNKTTRAVGYKTTSKVVKTPYTGTYYVKVRVYKEKNGKTYYGAWSSTKKIKVK